jgi:hypothetical protein
MDAASRAVPFWDDIAARLTAPEVSLAAGQYTCTADGRPLIGGGGLEGLYIHTGDNGWGIEGGPEAGRRLARIVAGAEPDDATTPYRLDRPGVAAARRGGHMLGTADALDWRPTAGADLAKPMHDVDWPRRSRSCNRRYSAYGSEYTDPFLVGRYGIGDRYAMASQRTRRVEASASGCRDRRRHKHQRRSGWSSVRWARRSRLRPQQPVARGPPQRRSHRRRPRSPQA